MTQPFRSLAKAVAHLLLSLSLIGVGLFSSTYSARGASVLFAKPGASGLGDCSSWANACSLQTALGQAGPGDAIWAAEGVHYPGTARTDTFTLVEGAALYGGFHGNETEPSQRDWMTYPTVLSGDIGQDDITCTNGAVQDAANIVGLNAYHVLTGTGLSAAAVLDGFVITAGQANGPADSDQRGGGIFITGSSPTLANLTFRGNTAVYGGGMASIAGSSPTMTEVKFNGNSASTGGGGMYNADSNPSLINVLFRSNSAGVDCGGMYNLNGSLSLVNVTFRVNSAGSHGGGMCNNSGSYMSLTNVLFSGNSAGAMGGGMANLAFNSLTLVNVTFSSNTAQIFGGAIYNSASSPSLTNNILWGNTSQSGAQIANNADGSMPEIANSIVEGAFLGSAWDSRLGQDMGANLASDPLFVDDTGLDGIPGSDDDDLRLGAGSPAVDAGDNSSVAPTVTSDLDGSPRFVDIPAAPDSGIGSTPIVDMGAYEQQMGHAPAFTSTPLLAVTEGALYRYAVTADDPDLVLGDVLTLTAPIGSGWLSLLDHGDGTAVLSGTPTRADIGQQAVVLRAADSDGLYAEQAFTITVSEPPLYGLYLPLCFKEAP